MSGGSFNYLGMKARYGETDQSSISTIEEMAKALEGMGEPAAKAAARTREILALYARINALGRTLHEVWTDMEWLRSGDLGEEYLLESLKRFDAQQSDLSGLAAREAQADK